MINGVLVERTVQDVIPALKTNSDGLRKVLEDLVKQYNSKQVEMEKWKVCQISRKSEAKSYSALIFCCYRKRTTSKSFSSDSRISKCGNIGLRA